VEESSVKAALPIFIMAGIVIALIAFAIWLNISTRRYKATLTPEELEEYERGSERLPGDW
jgi:NADH:ubiquinone oxidoreductase subunit 3 (subunit A)